MSLDGHEWDDGTTRAALSLTAGCHSAEVTNSVLDSHRESARWVEKRYGDWLFIACGSFFTYQNACAKHYSLPLCVFSCQASRNPSLSALLSHHSNHGQFIQEKDLHGDFNVNSFCEEKLLLILLFPNFTFSFILVSLTSRRGQHFFTKCYCNFCHV